MPRGTAGSNNDPLGRLELLANSGESTELYRSFLRLQTATEAITERDWLLVDLLQHEVLKAALFDLLEFKGNLLDNARLPSRFR